MEVGRWKLDRKKLVIGGAAVIVLGLLAVNRMGGGARVPLISTVPEYKKTAEVRIRDNQGLGPTFAVVDRDRQLAYVTIPKRECFELPETVAIEDRQSLIGVVDLKTNQLVKSIKIDNNLLGAALSPDGRWLYVTNSFDDRLTVIDTSTQEAIKTIAVGPDPVTVGNNACGGNYRYKPQFVTFSRDGRYAYTSNSKGGAVSVIESSGHSLVTRIETVPSDQANSQNGFAGSVWGLATHPKRDLIYTGGKISGQIYIINSSTNTKVGKIDLDPAIAPTGMAVDPAGENLWVSDVLSGVVVVVNTQTEEEIARVNIGEYGSTPSWITFSENGKWAFVSPTSGNTITVVDAKKFEIVSTIETEGYPFMGVEVNGKLLLTPREADSLQIWE